MEKMNKVMFYLFLIFLFLNISDGITTLFIIEGEANPIYLLTGQLWIIYLLKIFIIYFIWRLYKKNVYTSNFSYFLIISILVYGSLILFIAQVSNIYGMLNPQVIEAASQIPPQERATGYFWFTSIFYLAPLMFTLGIFYLYDKSLHTVKIDKRMRLRSLWRDD